MKIKNESGDIRYCSSCNGDDFKPLGGDRFECRTCGEPTAAADLEKKENTNQ